MGKKRFCIIFLITLISLICFTSGCTREETAFSRERIPSEEDLLSLKRPFQISDEDISSYIDPSQTVAKQIEYINQYSLEKEYKRTQILDKKSAEEDVDLFFNILKNCYPGYLPNGGDLRFNQAKEVIKEQIGSQVKAMDLEVLIRDNMAFVEDSHFTVGSKFYLQNKAWYTANDVIIDKKDNGYINIKNGKYIKNSEEIEPLIQPSLLKGRYLYYQLFAQDINELPKRIVYEDGTSDDIEAKAIYPSQDLNKGPVFKRKGNVAYLRIPRFYFSHEEDEYNIVIEGAKKMAQENYGLLDLRGNEGGNAILAYKWFEYYTGEKPTPSYDEMGIINPTIFENLDSAQTWEDFMEFSGAEVYGENHVITKHSRKTIPKEGILIVLIDAAVGSAGEILVDFLHHLENTVFIGMPTKGCCNGSSMVTLYMKNSNIPFNFGNFWRIFQKDYFQENRGFLPDVWAPDIDLDNIFELLNGYAE